MKQKELDKIIARHQHWINKDRNGWETMRANLSNADLSGLDLHGVKLAGADLSGADLSNIDLSNAELSNADMFGANLSGAKLTGAKLTGADLSNVNVSYANLTDATLCYADMTVADLTGAKLIRTNLAYAILRGAKLTGAKLTGANLQLADIYTAVFDAKENNRKGIVLKKAIKGFKNTAEGVVITATIPAGAVVYSINGDKCRTNLATITDMGGHKLLHSRHDTTFTYRVGKKILISDFDTRYNIECAKGFHFFRTKKEAEDYGAPRYLIKKLTKGDTP